MPALWQEECADCGESCGATLAAAPLLGAGRARAQPRRRRRRKPRCCRGAPTCSPTADQRVRASTSATLCLVNQRQRAPSPATAAGQPRPAQAGREPGPRHGQLGLLRRRPPDRADAAGARVARRATRRTRRASRSARTSRWGTGGYATPATSWPNGWPRPPHRESSSPANTATRAWASPPRCPPSFEPRAARARRYAIEFGVAPALRQRRAARRPQRRGTRPPSAPASEAGPPAEAMPSTRIDFSPRLSFSRPSLELTSSPDSSRTRSRR